MAWSRAHSESATDTGLPAVGRLGARALNRLLRITDGARSAAGEPPAGTFPLRLGNAAADKTLRLFAAGLAVSDNPAWQAIGTELAEALDAREHAAVRAIVATVTRRSDCRAEKMVSHRHGFLWICNAKVASRSLIRALRAADPEIELVRRRTVSEVLAARPEVRRYFSFAFVRHPCQRAFSCYADKYTLPRPRKDSWRYLMEPFHGVSERMTFVEWCRWLDTPYGSDAFADRHWLSQHRQIRMPDAASPISSVRTSISMPPGGP